MYEKISAVSDCLDSFFMSELELEAGYVAMQLQTQLSKILKRHDKPVRKYLQLAENIDSTPLFSEQEINDFLGESVMLPLEKVAALAGIMGRTLVIAIDGYRSAQIPVKAGNAPDATGDFLSQLQTNVYSLLLLLDQGFDNEKRAYKPLRVSEIKCSEVAAASDLSSFDALMTAARYHGFTVRLWIRRAT